LLSVILQFLESWHGSLNFSESIITWLKFLQAWLLTWVVTGGFKFCHIAGIVTGGLRFYHTYGVVTGGFKLFSDSLKFCHIAEVYFALSFFTSLQCWEIKIFVEFGFINFSLGWSSGCFWYLLLYNPLNRQHIIALFSLKVTYII
jgi:hypothetical protein